MKVNPCKVLHNAQYILLSSITRVRNVHSVILFHYLALILILCAYWGARELHLHITTLYLMRFRHKEILISNYLFIYASFHTPHKYEKMQ
jgi:hypothetical protein